jgi:hypothetical protein
MKKIYTLVLFAITFFNSNAQIVDIPDANFKAKLLEADYDNEIAGYLKIDINEDGEIQVSEALNVFILDVSYSNIQDMSGIEAFVNLTSLSCYTNQLTSLNIAQNTALTYLSLYENQLTNLDVTQNTALEYLIIFSNQLNSLDVTQNTALTFLSLNENQLTSLDVTQNIALIELLLIDNQLTSLDVTQNIALINLGCGNNQLTSLNVTQNITLIDIGCDNNQLTSLDVSQNVALEYINCSFNQLISLDFSQNIALINLGCSNNQLTSLDVSQNVALEYINCSYNQLISLDFSQNIALRDLLCYHNQLTTLDVTQNTELNDLWCDDNQLSSLYIKNSNQIWFDLHFDENPNLEYVCANENDLAMVQQKIIDYGYTNCHANTYCSFVPGGIFYTLQGNIKFDSNNNGCEVSDINMPNQKLTFTSGALNSSLIPNESGNYTYHVQSGTHVITPVIENPTYFIISPTSASVTFPAATSPFIQDFCITANGIKNDLEITIIPIEVARPGFDAHYKIVYKNKGNQIANGTLTFSFDDSIMDLVSSIPSIDGSATNSFNWNFSDLNPFETREIVLVFNINSPMETPAVNDGDSLVYTATFVGATDETPDDNTFTLNQTVVNSYDPNDKTCLEGNTISPNMVGQYVHYVIRFENTGTFAAENVVIADVIDATKFEISTLIPQSSSHNFFTRINGNKVEFIFENINLPFDDENNDGYVAFKIKTKSNLVVGNTFTNKANIYFDYNFPIITNTTSTTVEEPLSNQDFDFETNFSLYPNPASEVLNIKVKSELDVKSVSIYNTLGQIIMTSIHAENGEINVSNLQSGSYFIKVFTDKGSSTAKFIKQ